MSAPLENALEVLLSAPATQKSLGFLVGVSQQAVGAMVKEGKISLGGTLQQALIEYCDRLRDQAAGRLGGEVGGLDLVQERAGLAKEQREAQALKNAVARGEYAPIGLLEDVLATACSSVVAEFDSLEGSLRKTAPHLDEKAKETLFAMLAAARNKWIRSTARLVSDALDKASNFGDDDPSPDDLLAMTEDETP